MTLGGQPMSDWITRDAASRTHPVDRACHTVGIPLVALSVLAGLVTLAYFPAWPVFVGLFVIGWLFHFIGHGYGGKSPEFFADWRFLLVGVRWWFMKLGGKA